MKNIAIIESFSDDSRKPKWEAVKTKFGKSYNFHSIENEVEGFINAIPSTSLFILFAHLGDTQDFNEALFENCSSSNVVLIQYTGGVSQYQIAANSIENIHFDMLMDNIEIFLSHCQKMNSLAETDLGLLIAIDPELERLLKEFVNYHPHTAFSEDLKAKKTELQNYVNTKLC